MSALETIERQNVALEGLKGQLDSLGDSMDAKNAELARLRKENARLLLVCGNLIDACRAALFSLGEPASEYDPDATLRKALIDALAAA